MDGIITEKKDNVDYVFPTLPDVTPPTQCLQGVDIVDANMKDGMSTPVQSPKSNLNRGLLHDFPFLHVSSKVESQIACQQCGKMFSTKQSLSTHMKTAKSCLDKNKQKKIFQCNYCHKILSSKQMLLYHDGICTTKTQQVYEKKLEQLESMIHNTNHPTSSITNNNNAPTQPQSFYETNILVTCELINTHARIPHKRNPLTFDLFAAVNEPIEIPPSSKIIIPLGIRLGISNGWFANMMLSPNLLESGLNIVNFIVDATYQNELKVVMYNMDQQPRTLDMKQAVAQLAFYKCPDKFNIHLNCTSCVSY